MCAVGSAFIVVCAGCRLQVCGNVQVPGFMLGEHGCALSMDMLWPRYGISLGIGHRQPINLIFGMLVGHYNI